MKKMLTLSIALFSVVCLMAQPPKGPAKKGMTFGEKVTATGATDVNNLAELVNEEDETEVKIKGKVAEVCTKEGCWLKMQTGTGKMLVKMKDHEFLVPVAINGKEIVVSGTAKMKVTTVKELQHYAEDAGKSKVEIEAIKEPKKEIVVNATGILVL